MYFVYPGMDKHHCYNFLDIFKNKSNLKHINLHKPWWINIFKKFEHNAIKPTINFLSFICNIMKFCRTGINCLFVSLVGRCPSTHMFNDLHNLPTLPKITPYLSKINWFFPQTDKTDLSKHTKASYTDPLVIHVL